MGVRRGEGVGVGGEGIAMVVRWRGLVTEVAIGLLDGRDDE